MALFRRKAKSSIVVDDLGVRRTLRNGRTESVIWDDLIEVAIVTTSEGPANEDVFIVLHGANDTGCVVPQGHPVSQQLLARLQALAGFDNEKSSR